MVYATLTIENEILMDGERISAELFDAIARDSGNIRGLAEFRDRVELRPASFTICTSANPSPVKIGCFDGFLRYIFKNRVDVVFVYNGEEDFAVFDWCIHGDGAHPWERTSKEEQRENGRYKIVQGWKFAELSGDSGQRYYFGLWQQRKDNRGRIVTRGAQFYALANIFTKGEREFVESFGAGDYQTRAERLFHALRAFDSLCSRELHAPFIGKNGKPLAMTAGTLARIELFRGMYGDSDAKTNAQIFKRNHRTEKGVGAFFRVRKLFRGGICCGAFDKWGVKLEPPAGGNINKYDINSEYSSVARNMPDLCAPEICENIDELYKRRAGYTYIVVFGALHARRKKGMPAVFANPWNGASTEIHITKPFAIFADELDELRHFYTFGDCEIIELFRCREHSRGVFAPFVDMWYQKKLDAKRAGDLGLYALAKLVNNGAWGQFGKRSKFPVVAHVYNNATRLFELKEIEPADEENDDGAYSFILGARVPSLARIFIMQKIRRLCGDKNALKTFIYCDTDSITTYAEFPAEEVSAERLGAFKLETRAVQAVFLSKKLYYTIERLTPLKIDIHARGIPARSIVDALLENYGAESVAELPADAFAVAFTSGGKFITPVTLNVRGGRLRFYVNKALTLQPTHRVKYESIGGAVFGIDENGNLFEI